MNDFTFYGAPLADVIVPAMCLLAGAFIGYLIRGIR